VADHQIHILQEFNVEFYPSYNKHFHSIDTCNAQNSMHVKIIQRKCNFPHFTLLNLKREVPTLTAQN